MNDLENAQEDGNGREMLAQGGCGSTEGFETVATDVGVFAEVLQKGGMIDVIVGKRLFQV